LNWPDSAALWQRRTARLDPPARRVNRPVPSRRSPSPAHKPATRPRASFRHRYDELEAHRTALVARLSALGAASKRHPGYRRALRLLNETFRKERLTHRLAVLQAAAWLIDLLEKVNSVT
jgi:hypothetical protein